MIIAVKNGQRGRFAERIWDMMPPGKNGWVRIEDVFAEPQDVGAEPIKKNIIPGRVMAILEKKEEEVEHLHAEQPKKEEMTEEEIDILLEKAAVVAEKKENSTVKRIGFDPMKEYTLLELRNLCEKYELKYETFFGVKRLRTLIINHLKAQENENQKKKGRKRIDSV